MFELGIWMVFWKRDGYNKVTSKFIWESKYAKMENQCGYLLDHEPFLTSELHLKIFPVIDIQENLSL